MCGDRYSGRKEVVCYSFIFLEKESRNKMDELVVSSDVGVSSKANRLSNLEVLHEEFINSGKVIKAAALKDEYIARFGDSNPSSLLTTIYNFIKGKSGVKVSDKGSDTLEVTNAVNAAIKTMVVESDLEFLEVPVSNPTYHISDNDKVFLEIIEKESKEGQIANIMLIGPHGCGKTELAKEYAARNNKVLFHTNCAMYREPRDFYGFKGAKSGSTYWRKSDFIKAIERPNTVILLDEFNRCSPMVANSLFNLLDDTRAAIFDEIGKVTVGSGTVIFGTINRGTQYTGTMISDAAVMDRFGNTIEVGYLPDELEIDVLVKRTGIDKANAKLLVQLGNTIRSKASEMGSTIRNSVSTRLLIKTAERYKTMGKDAFSYTILPLYSKEGGTNSERTQITQMIQMVFGD